MQTAKDACTSVALLNIVNNIPDIELGDHLQFLKEYALSEYHNPCIECTVLHNARLYRVDLYKM